MKVRVISLFLLIFLFGCGNGEKSKTAVISTANGTYQFILEIADTPSKRSRGLMFRESLDNRTGMLFIFPGDTKTSFWMKDTSIPLDILFINQNLSIVSVAENTEPFSENLIPSSATYRYALEVNTGFVKESGVKVGDKVKLNF